MSMIVLSLQTVAGTVHLYAIRPFTVTFLLALQQFFQAQAALFEPPFVAHPLALFVLGVLTAAEWGMELNIDTRELQQTYSQMVSPAVAVLSTLGYLDTQSYEIMETLASTVPMLAQDDGGGAMGFVGTIFQWVGALIAGAVVWVLAGMRSILMMSMAELDEDDDLGIRSVLSWSENIFVVVGFIVFVLLPLVSIAIFALTSLALFLTRKYIEHREQKSRIPCTHCATPILPSATTCHNCGQTNPGPRDIGVFGQPRKQLAPNLAAHPFRLMTRKRCPSCATRLTQKSIHQQCSTCGTVTFKSAEQIDTYLATLRQQLPRTLLITGGLGLIPLVGLVPGIVYYRLSLLTGLRAYIPRGVGCVTRWGVRFWNLFLISFQWVPVFGALMLPAMALSNFLIYQQIVQREKERIFSQTNPIPDRVPPPQMDAGESAADTPGQPAQG